MPFRNYPEENVEREFYLRNGRSYMRSQTDPDSGNITLRPELNQPDNRLTELRRTRREDADYAIATSEDVRPGVRKRAQKRINKREDNAARFADRNYKRKRIAFKPILVIISCVLWFALLGALVNLVFNFFDADSIIYAASPNADASFGIFKEGATLSLDVDFVLDLDEVLHRLADGAVFGVAVGLVIGLLSCLIRAIAEGARYLRFRRVRHSLERARYVICESFVKVKDNPADIFYADPGKKKKGTLFLTKRSLEFYDNSYLTPYRNFLVKLSDITVVESKGTGKVTIYTAKGKYTIRVPKGRAKFWKRSLLHAIQNGQRANFGR
ncbi:MAG: hypothetical protein IJW03_02230 [Clostridia bacterium]|nr:hypothetical protein [Clostridia bacterium]